MRWLLLTCKLITLSVILESQRLSFRLPKSFPWEHKKVCFQCLTTGPWMSWRTKTLQAFSPGVHSSSKRTCISTSIWSGIMWIPQNWRKEDPSKVRRFLDRQKKFSWWKDLLQRAILLLSQTSMFSMWTASTPIAHAARHFQMSASHWQSFQSPILHLMALLNHRAMPLHNSDTFSSRSIGSLCD